MKALFDTSALVTAVVERLPNHATLNRQAKLKIREMGSRHFFIVAYVWPEKHFSRGDCRRRES